MLSGGAVGGWVAAVAGRAGDYAWSFVRGCGSGVFVVWCGGIVVLDVSVGMRPFGFTFERAYCGLRSSGDSDVCECA